MHETSSGFLQRFAVVSALISVCVCVCVCVCALYYVQSVEVCGLKRPKERVVSHFDTRYYDRPLHWLSHTHTHTHTHAHGTHMLGFHVLWGLSIDVMVFILYKLYILSPYTAPIPKPNHHRRHSAILHFQNTSLSLIYKLVSSWGPKNVPTRTRILDIAIVVGTFCPHNVGYT